MWFSCSCLRPELLEKLNKITPEAGEQLSLWQKKVLFALHWGDCRLSYRGSGKIVFDGHEFLCKAEGTDKVTVTFSEDCVFTVKEADLIISAY